MNHKATWGASVLVALALTGLVSLAQSVMPAPKFTAYDSNGDPCAGCLLYAYAAGTTTPQDTYTTSALSVANANPVVLDAAGRATVFLSDTLSYKFTLKTAGGVDIWTVDNIVGQLASVVNVTAADSRGLRVTRTSGDAGISITSSGGSGKTYALSSTTAGEFRIQDDTDGTPRFSFVGDNIDAVQTGTFTVNGGLLAVSGFGAHVFSAGGTGSNQITVRNTTAGTGNYARLSLGNDAGAGAGTLTSYSSTFTTSGAAVQDSTVLAGARAGGISINASDASGDIRFYAGGATTPALTINDAGYTIINRLITTSTQPSSGTTHNYDIGAASVIIYNSGVGAATVTGMTGGTNGRQVWVVRSPASSGDITLSHENAGSTAANRITSATGADITVTSVKAVQLIYDDGSQRWLAFDVK